MFPSEAWIARIVLTKSAGAASAAVVLEGAAPAAIVFELLPCVFPVLLLPCDAAVFPVLLLGLQCVIVL